MRALSRSQVFCKSKTLFRKPTLAATGSLDQRGKKEGLTRETSGFRMQLPPATAAGEIGGPVQDVYQLPRLVPLAKPCPTTGMSAPRGSVLQTTPPHQIGGHRINFMGRAAQWEI